MSTQSTQDKKEKFLKCYRTSLNISETCRKVKVGRKTFYDWKEKDPQFAEDVVEAYDDAIDKLEGTAYKLAKNGDRTLLIFMLKSLKREVYGDNVNFSGNINAQITDTRELAEKFTDAVVNAAADGEAEEDS